MDLSSKSNNQNFLQSKNKSSPNNLVYINDVDSLNETNYNNKEDQEDKVEVIFDENYNLGEGIDENDADDDEESQNNVEENAIAISKRNWYQRCFSSIKPGSVRASIFNLSILTVGTGCLALPQRFGQLSVLLSTIEIILSSFIAYWTLDLLIYASIKSGETSYSKVIRKLLGNKWANFLDGIIVVHISGVLIIYQIIGISKIY